MMPVRSAFTRPLMPTRGYAYRQRRTFLGLQRTPPPKPAMSAYLVVQGLAIVLLIDLGIATVMRDKTTFRSICQAAGWWQDPPGFDKVHASPAEGEKSG